MAQPKPEDKTTLDQVLKLVHQLSADEQEQLVQETIKLQELRRELMIGVKQLECGERLTGQQVFQEIRERHQDCLSLYSAPEMFLYLVPVDRSTINLEKFVR